jgi:hypothetical protein
MRCLKLSGPELQLVQDPLEPLLLAMAARHLQARGIQGTGGLDAKVEVAAELVDQVAVSGIGIVLDSL